LGDAAQAKESVEFFGDGEVLAVQDLDIGQMQQILGDGDGLRADVAGRQRIGGLVPDRDLDVTVAAGESQVGIEAFDRLDAEAQLFPGFVPDYDAPVAAIAARSS
jgi:hypothetical protein